MPDTHTAPLFLDSPEEALKEVIKIMGGAKVVGAKMRPEMLAVDAGTWLSDCLNQNKRDKLSLAQVMWILREARKVGCHVAMNYLCGDAGYADPQPIEPEDEIAKLQRVFIESTKALGHVAARIEHLASTSLKVRS